jgi:hypothetical protein
MPYQEGTVLVAKYSHGPRNYREHRLRKHDILIAVAQTVRIIYFICLVYQLDHISLIPLGKKKKKNQNKTMGKKLIRQLLP